MADFQLELTGREQAIPGMRISVTAPGLRGTLEVDARPAPGEGALLTRSSLRDSGEINATDEVDQAVREVGALDSVNLETEAPTPEVARAEGVRAGGGELADDEVQLKYEANPGEYSYMIYRDESGAISIHFPENLPQAGVEPGARLRAGGGQEQQFRIQLRKPAAPAAGPEAVQTRFGVVAIGKKLLKLVVGKIVEKTAGKAAGAVEFGAVWVWEDRARHFEGFHGGKDAAALLAENPAAMTNQDWAALNGDGKKTLLFLHGTTSTTSGAFGGLSKFSGIANALYQKYEGRVVGFNHHTLTKSVADNAADFYSGLPASGNYNFDIVCHSRGGLVARALKELSIGDVATLATRPCQCTAKISIGTIVFVGTPNIGTELADPKDIPHALNLLSNVASLIPGAGLTLAGIFSWAAFVAENGFAALPGMRNMNPTDGFLKEINDPAPAAPSPLADYHAIQSNFGAQKIVNQVLLEAVKYLFKGQLNDLIVPTLGVSEIDGKTLAGTEVKYYGEPPNIESVAHTQYFQHQETWDYIVKKLG